MLTGTHADSHMQNWPHDVSASRDNVVVYSHAMLGVCVLGVGACGCELSTSRTQGDDVPPHATCVCLVFLCACPASHVHRIPIPYAHAHTCTHPAHVIELVCLEVLVR